MELAEVRDQPEALDLVGRFNVDGISPVRIIPEPLARIARRIAVTSSRAVLLGAEHRQLGEVDGSDPCAERSASSASLTGGVSVIEWRALISCV